jgi:hypothetical protein
VKPAPFAYRRPATPDEAANLLAEFAPQDGRVLTGLPGGVTQLRLTGAAPRSSSIRLAARYSARQSARSPGAAGWW